MTDDLSLDLAALGAIGIDRAMISERHTLDGDRALAFLAELPGLVERWQAELGLSDARLLPGGVLSAAFLCRQGAEQVVLKLSASSATAEAAALEAWNGRGACRLRFAAIDGQALLLDAIRPGHSPQPGPEATDTRRAGALMRCLHRAAIPAAVPEARQELDWRFERAHQLLDGPSPARGRVSHEDLQSAHHRALGFDAERPVTVLVHGDFLDKNILVDGAGRWWAIDPRPCRGDPCMDAAFWALAHRGGRGAVARIPLLAAATGLPAERVESWMRVFAVCESVLAHTSELAAAYSAVAGARTRRSMR